MLRKFAGKLSVSRAAATHPRSYRRVAAAIGVVTALTAVCYSRQHTFLPGPQGASRPQVAQSGAAQHAASKIQRQSRGGQSATLEQVDNQYNPQWDQIEGSTIDQLNWANPQTGFAGAATGLFIYDLWRFINLVPATAMEAAAAGIIYTGLYMSRYQEVSKMNPHYQVSFYASCGWTVYAFASLVHALAYSPEHVVSRGLADAFHGGACAIYLGSCAYFYSYHWGRMWRHLQEGRFRPLFAAGLGSLTFVHGLTVAHIFKVLDDPLWWQTVVQIYPDQWRYLADTRFVELYLTAAALFLVILHIRGVLTGTLNALIVFFGTVILPTAALMSECLVINACMYNHYWMVGPKHY